VRITQAVQAVIQQAFFKAVLSSLRPPVLPQKALRLLLRMPRAACGEVGPVRGWGDEAILGRPPRTAAGRHRRWLTPGRGGPPLRRRTQHHQAVATTAPGDR
jgi:hypothetical protein